MAMSEIENLVLEHLKRIQTEQTAARERDQEILTRLAHIESGLARITRDESANYAEIVENRHSMDKLRERVERIERRLELS
jgi:chromosome segregation ATPase